MTNNVSNSANNRFAISWVRNDGASYVPDADIGVILFYNRKLSASEIKQLYDFYAPNYRDGKESSALFFKVDNTPSQIQDLSLIHISEPTRPY